MPVKPLPNLRRGRFEHVRQMLAVSSVRHVIAYVTVSLVSNAAGEIVSLEPPKDVADALPKLANKSAPAGEQRGNQPATGTGGDFFKKIIDRTKGLLIDDFDDKQQNY